ncbi:MAG: glutaminyl-peptide cyclotransferase [Oscillochloris sp.]|nr:glutaminyl-peptide cyclotransferase [Oscillochloris sp.]
MRFNLLARIAALASAALLSFGCTSPSSSAATIGDETPRLLTTISTAITPQPATPSAPSITSAPINYSYQVVNRYAHDTAAWTEGLVYRGNNRLYESTGEYEHSSLREVQLDTGEVLYSVGLGNASLYGEGIAVVGDTIFQLTWQNCVGLLYHTTDFTQYGQFSLPTSNGTCAMEGWGLTYDGNQLIMSDGTSTLSFIDPAATITSGELTITRQVQVTNQGVAVTQLNELEYINGSVFANIWQTNTIVQIDPSNGQVIGVIDLSGLLSPSEQVSADVLNGIAYDAANNRLFVTGKYWPTLFEIQLDPAIAYAMNLPLVIQEY